MDSFDQTLPSDLRSYLGARSAASLELARLFSSRMPLTIFDIGSCEGEDSIRYAQQFPCSRLFAFEPLPENISLIHSNFHAFNLKNAEIVPCALSDETGKAEFHVSSGAPKELFAGANWNYGNKSSSLLPPASKEPMFGWINFEGVITVPTTTLADFCAKREISKIDFIHMDVQGAEFLVLKGAGRALDRIVAVWLEVSETEQYAGQALRADIHRLMRSRGFVCSHAIRRKIGEVIEGDDFYVNLRYPRVWRYFAWLSIRRLFGASRFWAGAVKNFMRRKVTS